MCRKLIYLISFVLVLGLCPHLAHGDVGLVGYWKFDELSGKTAIDSAGGDNNGTLRGFRLQWKPSEGRVGGALRYGGDPQACVAFPTTGMSTTAATIALWGYLDDPQPGQTRYFFGHTTIPSWANRIQIYMDDPTNMLDIGLGNSHTVVADILPLQTQTWYHIALTWDAGTYVVYINGEEMTRGSYSGLTTLNTEADIGNDGDQGRDEGFGGLIDEVRLYNRALTQAEIQTVMTFLPVLATNPYPADEATDVPRDVVLSWTPGTYAPAVNGHTVYISESFNDVNDGIGGVTQSAASYAPPQRLDFSKTYYWRVDEVNNVNPESPWTGSVWSFTIEPFTYPIQNIIATASSSEVNKGPENTVNGSGLDESGLLHGNVGGNNMWLSGIGGPQPTWIQYEFDRVYKLHEMWVWNSNQMIEPALGLGCKDVSIEYSLDGTDYTPLGTTAEFARAPGMPDYTHNTTIDFGGVTAKHVRLTANSNWGGILSQYGLSEVRFFYIPVRAREPYPDSGATGVDLDVTLGFRAGREAAQHDVYIGTDEQAVIDGTAPVVSVAETSYGPLSLDLDVTHYWKVNEVNEAETPPAWQGDVWDFTTREFRIVDDFESYNDLDTTDPESNRIFNTWIDGYGIPTNGSLVGYEAPPFAERSTVHGGEQSMPVFYANTGGAAYSEAERTFAVGQDWTTAGAQTLALYFHGTAGNTGQLYAKINGTKVPYGGQAGNIALTGWQVWNIDLASSGAGLQSVTKLAIGIDGNGASGTLLFDDIGLYVVALVPVTEVRIATEDDDAEEAVATGSIDLGSGDLELPYEDTGQGNLQIIGVRFTGIPIPKGATITDAWVRFQVDETKGGTDPVNLIIEGERSPNPATFSSVAKDISNRPTTTAQVQWSVPNWTTVGDQGPDQTTPGIASIIQEIVNQDGWAGNAIVLMFRDNPANPSLGIRCAVAGPGSNAVLLHIDYQ